MRLFYFLSLLSILFLISCEQDRSGSEGTINNLSSYMAYVNKAELNLIADQLDSAFLNYDNAFHDLKNVYAKDLYNASVLSFKLDKKEKGFSFLKKLFQKGISIDGLQEAEYYDSISQSDKELWQSIGELANKTKVSESISTVLYDQMDSLNEMDQLFRNKIRPNPYPVYGDTIEKIDDLNFEYLLNTVESAFPSEEKIGTHNIYGYLPHYIVIHHVFQHYGSQCNQILDSAINKRQIHPYYYSYLKDIGHKTFKGDYGNIVFHDLNNQVLRELKGDLKEKINKNRDLIGLSTMDDYYTKVEYVLAGNKEFIFHANAILDPRAYLPKK